MVPPEIPIVDPSSPQFADLVLIDLISTEVAKNNDLPCGTRHPDSAKYPNYVLILKRPLPGDEKWVQRFWTADPVCEDTFNLSRQSFDEEDATKEVFQRHYLIRRTEYISSQIPAKLSSLTGVIAVRVTAGGSGYDATTTVSFAGGAGTGAAASPIIFRGVLVGIYMTAEGSGYTSAPAVTITGPGAAAAATARIQPVSAKLISEQANRMEGEPEDGLYLKITRVYHTLPGAIVTSYSSGSGGTLKRTRRQKIELPVDFADFPDTDENIIGQKVTAIPELGTVVGIKETEDYVSDSDGETSSVPWISHSETVEPEGVKLVTHTKIVVPATEAPPMGQDYLETPGDMAAGQPYTGRRRIPTFPTGITDAGDWEDQQGYVVHSERRDIEDSPNKLLIVQTTCKPFDLYQFPNHTWQFPALLTYDSSDPTLTLYLVNGKLPLRVSESFVYLNHRTRTVVACSLQKFSINQFDNAALSHTFYLEAPGAGSVFFGQLDANTIYANLDGGQTTVQIYDTSAGALIEEFPFSTVSGCYPTTTGTLPTYYRLVARCIPWKGNIWVREYLIVRESGDIVDNANDGEFDSNLNGSAVFDNA